MHRYLTATPSPQLQLQKPLPRKSLPLSSLPPKAAEAAAAVSALATPPSSSSSPSSSSQSPSPVTSSESFATTTTTTMTTVVSSSKSSTNKATAMASAKTTSSTLRQKSADKSNKKEETAAERYKRLSSTPAAPAATIAASSSQADWFKDDYDDTSEYAAAAVVSVTPVKEAKKRKKKKSVQDDPKYQAAIRGSSTTATDTAKKKDKKTKTPPSQPPPPPRSRSRLVKASELVDAEAEVEDADGTVRKRHADGDDVAEVDAEVAAAEEEAATVDQTHAIKRFKTEARESRAALENMRDAAIAIRERARRWQKFATDELKACESGKEEDREHVKTVANMLDLVKAFSDICPPRGDAECVYRSSIMDTVKDSTLLGIGAVNVETQKGLRKFNVMTYMHPGSDGSPVKVTASVCDRDTRIASINTVQRDVPLLAPAWSGPVGERLDAESEAVQWQAACSGPDPSYEAPWECAARLFLLSHQVGKPFSSD